MAILWGWVFLMSEVPSVWCFADEIEHPNQRAGTHASSLGIPGEMCCGPLSPHSGRDCAQSLRSSSTGVFPQRQGMRARATSRSLPTRLRRAMFRRRNRAASRPPKQTAGTPRKRRRKTTKRNRCTPNPQPLTPNPQPVTLNPEH